MGTAKVNKARPEPFWLPREQGASESDLVLSRHQGARSQPAEPVPALLQRQGRRIVVMQLQPSERITGRDNFFAQDRHH